MDEIPEPSREKLTAQTIMTQPETASSQAKQARTFAAFKHRNYQLYFGGQLVSVIGTWMQIIAQSWMVYQLSHSELMLGIVGFASAIPVLFISPWGGVVVDSVPKRRLLVATQVGAMLLAFTMAALSFSGLLQVWQIIVLAVLLGVVNAFDAPGRQAFVVEMVGREDLPNAIALNSMMFNGARVIGPAMGGLLLAAVGPSWCFFLNGLSFLAVIASLLAMQVPDFVQKVNNAKPLERFKEGLRYAGAHRDIIGLLVLAAIFAVFGSSYSTLLPAFIDQQLHTGPAGYGIVNAAIGSGAVLGALAIARYGGSGRRGPWLVIALLIYPFILALFAYNWIYDVALLLGFCLGVGFMIIFTIINSLIQLNVVDEMRGRVLSLYTLTFFGIAPFGSLIAGAMAQVWGMSETIALSALVTLIGAIVVLTVVPEIRKMA
jgi:MFS family permease